MWTIINSTTNRTKRQHEIKIVENKVLLDDMQAANKFNQYFVNISKTVTSSLNANIDHDFLNANVPIMGKSFFFLPGSQRDVHETILNLKNSCSSGEDEISNYILQGNGYLYINAINLYY